MLEKSRKSKNRRQNTHKHNRTRSTEKRGEKKKESKQQEDLLETSHNSMHSTVPRQPNSRVYSSFTAHTNKRKLKGNKRALHFYVRQNL